MPNNYDIEQCTWCNGAGIDQSYNGKPNPPSCVRCHGSGKVYVTDELATTKRRRKYMGPVPKVIDEIEPIAIPVIAFSDIKWEGSRGTFEMAQIQSPDAIQPKKKRGRPPKVASGNNPT